MGVERLSFGLLLLRGVEVPEDEVEVVGWSEEGIWRRVDWEEADTLERMAAEGGLPDGMGVAAPDSGIKWTRRRASRRALSVCWWKGSRLLRTVPEKRTGSFR